MLSPSATYVKLLGFSLAVLEVALTVLFVVSVVWETAVSVFSEDAAEVMSLVVSLEADELAADSDFCSSFFVSAWVVSEEAVLSLEAEGRTMTISSEVVTFSSSRRQSAPLRLRLLPAPSPEASRLQRQMPEC